MYIELFLALDIDYSEKDQIIFIFNLFNDNN